MDICCRFWNNCGKVDKNSGHMQTLYGYACRQIGQANAVWSHWNHFKDILLLTSAEQVKLTGDSDGCMSAANGFLIHKCQKLYICRWNRHQWKMAWAITQTKTVGREPRDLTSYDDFISQKKQNSPRTNKLSAGLAEKADSKVHQGGERAGGRQQWTNMEAGAMC